MASITTSVEIARSPEEVFGYITDVPRHPEWQEGLVSATLETLGVLMLPLARRQASRQVAESHEKLKHILEGGAGG
jgi:hypothetical protein